jgi:hypothetical protein
MNIVPSVDINVPSDDDREDSEEEKLAHEEMIS